MIISFLVKCLQNGNLDFYFREMWGLHKGYMGKNGLVDLKQSGGCRGVHGGMCVYWCVWVYSFSFQL